MLLLLLLLADVAAAELLVTRDGRVAIVVVLETKELLVATFSLGRLEWLAPSGSEAMESSRA